jgi:hypothetical protein
MRYVRKGWMIVGRVERMDGSEKSGARHNDRGRNLAVEEKSGMRGDEKRIREAAMVCGEKRNVGRRMGTTKGGM